MKCLNVVRPAVVQSVSLAACMLLCSSAMVSACMGAGSELKNASGSGSGSGGGNGSNQTGQGGGIGISVGSGGNDIGPAFLYDCGSNKAYKDPALSDDVCDRFGGEASSSGAPAIVYPLDHSMHAMNLHRLTFQWSQGSATNTLFRVDAVGDSGTYSFFLPCDQPQCTYDMPQNEWLTLGDIFAGGAAVSFTVHGTDGQDGPVASSTAIDVYYSPSSLLGAVYYWAAENREIKRAQFGADAAVPFIVPNSSSNDYECIGCHSVSRDGSVIAFAVAPEIPPEDCEPPLEHCGGENIAAIQTAPTDDPNSPYIKPSKGTSPYPANMRNGNEQGPTEYFGHNVALSPDGSLAAINGVPPDTDTWPPYFEIRDAKTGETIVKHELYDSLFGTERIPILPEWSPDGTKLAVTLADSSGDTAEFGCVWTSETCRSSIAVLSYDNGVLGAPEVLVQGSGDEYHFYPSWSPDGKYLAFASASWNSSEPYKKSMSNSNAILYLIPSSGGPYTCPGPDCQELTRGMQYTGAEAKNGQGKQSTWPKFTPFAQGPNNNLFFISMNAKMDYGFLSTGENQIWVFAVDIDQLSSGDPSYAPVWLPYQDYTDGSLTAYWTETLPCTADPEGGCAGCAPGEECVVNEQTNECYCKGVVK